MLWQPNSWALPDQLPKLACPSFDALDNFAFRGSRGNVAEGSQKYPVSIITGVSMGAKSKSAFTPKTGYQPLFPCRGPVPGDLAMKFCFCSVVGAHCLQRWRLFVQVPWPIFGSILRTRIWTHVSISLFNLNKAVQTWTHFCVHFTDPNSVRQVEPKTHKNRIRGSNFRNLQLHCGKAVAAQAVPTNWRGTDLCQPVFGAKVDLLFGSQHIV